MDSIRSLRPRLPLISNAQSQSGSSSRKACPQQGRPDQYLKKGSHLAVSSSQQLRKTKAWPLLPSTPDSGDDMGAEAPEVQDTQPGSLWLTYQLSPAQLLCKRSFLALD